MLKVAVIFEGSPFDRKGLFNAVHSRIRSLSATGECTVDAYCIHSWDTDFTRKRRGTPFVDERRETVEVEGIAYRMLWYDFSLVDFALVEKLHVHPFFFSRHVRSWIPLFGGYDRLVAHSFAGGLVARAASASLGIPYLVTWHGSDIHTHPMRNPLIFRETAAVMKDAACNFFVSEALMRESEKIVMSGDGSDGAVSAVLCRKEVLHNGVAEGFEKFPEHCREEVRRNNGLEEGDKVVAFVGSIVAVKNVSVLQPLFHEIALRYKEAVTGCRSEAGESGDGICAPAGLKFWMVGDGKLRGSVEPAMAADSSIDVSFWGDVPSEHMPSVMNCIDVLVLPSLNEGLPLVCAEALRCGASVVGSDVGGISEVIGRDSVVPLGPDFVPDFADKVVRMLISPVPQPVPPSLDWTATARKELSLLKSL